MTASATRLPRLTSLSPGAGSACKLPFAKLEELLSSLGDMEPASGDLIAGAIEDQAAPGDWLRLTMPLRRIAEGGAGQIRVHAA